ncbi:hypothetical protein EJB05_56418, partial [Eragrostis curvula]
MAPGARIDASSAEEGVLLSEAERFLGQQHLTRETEIHVAKTSRPGPHIHGVEDRRGYRFWALESDGDSSCDEEDSDGESISNSIVVHHAAAAGFSVQHLVEAETELLKNPKADSDDKSLSSSIINAVASRMAKVSPWRGPLPRPRKSPPMTLGAALTKAKVSPQTTRRSSSSFSYPLFLTNPAIAGVGDGDAMPIRSKGNRASQTVDHNYDSKFESKVTGSGQATKVGYRTLKLGPHMPYRPTPGLVALFARTGTHISASPRAPHIASQHNYRRTYLAAAKSSMDGGAMNTGKGPRVRRQTAATATAVAGAAAMEAVATAMASNPSPSTLATVVARGVVTGVGAEAATVIIALVVKVGGIPAVGVEKLVAVAAAAAAIAKTCRDNRNAGGQLDAPLPLNAEAVAQAAALLQQAFADAQRGKLPQQEPVKCQKEELSKSTPSADVPESSDQAATKGSSGNKAPYCYRCYTKGHAIKDCTADCYCEIHDNNEHDTIRCPTFRGTKITPKLCGYAVEGLGFYHIPYTVTHKHKSESQTALIKVSKGNMNSSQVTSELERLVSNRWRWAVQDIGKNSFKATFPSKAELQRMVEWGVVHTKYNADMQVIERVARGEAKSNLPRVWVQFTGLPKELQEFEVIWAVGSILGITKWADMRFVRQYDICRIQVLVLDPNLIPQFVDVVIGDELHGLEFRVEENMDEDNPEPMDMDRHGNGDDDHDEQHDGAKDDRNEKNGGNASKEPKSGGKPGNLDTTNKQVGGQDTVRKAATPGTPPTSLSAVPLFGMAAQVQVRAQAPR